MTKTVTINLSKLISYVVSVAIIATAILFTYWLSQPTEVLEIKNDPLPVKPSEVTVGDGRITLDIDFCKMSNATGQVRVFLVGEQKGQKPELAWPDDQTKKGCLRAPLDIQIPASVQTDTYHVVFEVRYRINPIKSSELTVFRSRSFKVVNAALQPGAAKPE